MSHVAVPKPSEPTKAAARRIAVIVAIAVWCFGMIFVMVNGKGLPEALAGATFAALGGLLIWMIFHRLSRCNDLFCAAFLAGTNTKVIEPPLTAWPSLDWLPLCPLWVSLIFGLVLAFRGPKAKAGGDDSKPADPLYDAEVDHLPGTPVAN